MGTPAQDSANAKNAKKSTGPRTLIGLNRTRLNNLKHGMRAAIALLPDEDATKFKQRIIDWVAVMKPRNRLELYLAERAVYLSWQLDRASRAQSANLCMKAFSAAKEREDRVKQEVADLTRRLFRISSGRTNAVANVGSVRGLARDPWPGAFDDAEHPALLVGQLESTRAGCRWLRERWNELGTILEEGRTWLGSDRFKAIRLLRIHPIDILDAPELTALLQACQVLDPRAGDLVDGMLEGLVPADSARSFERLFEGRTDRPAPPDQAAARQQLLEVVRREIAKLEARIERHQKQDEVEASLLQDRLAFDGSPDGEMLRRYEITCSELLFRILDDLSKGRVEKRSRSAASSAEHRAVSPTWFKQLADAIDSPAAIDRLDETDIRGAFDQACTMVPANGSPSSASEHTAKAQRILQDEAMSAMLAGPHLDGRRENVGASPVRDHRIAKQVKTASEKKAQITPT